MFSKKDIEIYTNIIGSYMPNGRTFTAKHINKTNLRNFFKSFGFTLKYIDEIFDGILNDYDIINTTNIAFIELWEKAVGIPDECFNIEDTIEKRKANIIIKLTAKNIITAHDMVELLKKLGYNIQITPGVEGNTFPMIFPFILADEKYLRNTIIVNLSEDLKPENIFPMIFPFKFSEINESLIECIMNKIIPANAKIFYKYIL